MILHPPSNGPESRLIYIGFLFSRLFFSREQDEISQYWKDQADVAITISKKTKLTGPQTRRAVSCSDGEKVKANHNLSGWSHKHNIFPIKDTKGEARKFSKLKRRAYYNIENLSISLDHDAGNIVSRNKFTFIATDVAFHHWKRIWLGRDFTKFWASVRFPIRLVNLGRPKGRRPTVFYFSSSVCCYLQSKIDWGLTSRERTTLRSLSSPLGN